MTLKAHGTCPRNGGGACAASKITFSIKSRGTGLES
jgi:hypothetical protein